MHYGFDLKVESTAFGKSIISLYKQLIEAKEFVLSKQVLRSGTSIGANIREAKYGYSKRDFLYKCSIALKEAVETEYWFELLEDGGFVKDVVYFKKYKVHLLKIIKVLVRTMNSTRKALEKK